jgi:hypothetical protein
MGMPQSTAEFLALDQASMDSAWERALQLIRDRGEDPEALIAAAAKNLPDKLPLPEDP